MKYITARNALVIMSVMTAGLIPTLPATQAAGVDSSPFAGKPCISYAGTTWPDGKPLLWGEAPFNDYGAEAVTFDNTGVRPLRPAPPPGVHPRILVTPGDLPEIRDRLKSTAAGQNMWKNVLSWSNLLRGTYDENADYAKPDLYKGDYRGTHGRVPLLYMHDKDSPWNPANHVYQDMIGGNAATLQAVDSGKFWPLMAIDALRCWVDGDAAAAANLGRAAVNLMRSDQAKRAADRAARHTTAPIDQPVGSYNLSFIYDFIYDWLTPEQRTALHQEIADTTWVHDNYGTFNSAESTRSNWASFSYWLMELMAIEGEPGYNDLKYQGMYRAWRNFLTYGVFPDGGYFEGEAKAQLGMDGVIVFARRANNLTAPDLDGHPHLRAYATRFLPESAAPTARNTREFFGHGPFIKYDLLGGVGSILPIDAIGLKYMFPNDKIIDWAYRQEVGDEYQDLPADPFGYYNEVVFATLFATDFDPTNNDPAKLNLPRTYFSNARGLMMTRSSWDKDALMLNLHTRGASGGHNFADKNSIFLAGAGRVWAALNTWQDDNFAQSEVTIDGKPQGLTVPGKIVGVFDQPQATFAVGDASYAWDWTWRRIDDPTLTLQTLPQLKIPAGWEPEMHSFNDFVYTGSSNSALTLRPSASDTTYAGLKDPVFDEPLFHLPGWNSPKGVITPIVRQPNYPVKKAFRTAGIVRGPHPYALVVDDIQKDDTVHHYDWQLLLDDDVEVYSVTTPRLEGKTNDQQEFDVTLSGAKSLAVIEKGQPLRGEPMLLVRVLSRIQDSKTPPPVHGLAYLALDRSRRLVIPADAVSPDFKVLLYPYKQGDPLPTTTWDSKRHSVTVSLPNQEDTVLFTPSPAGSTGITVTRSQTPIANTNATLAAELSIGSQGGSEFGVATPEPPRH